MKEILFDLRMTIKKRDGPRRLTSISAVTGKKPEKIQASTEFEPVPPRYWLLMFRERSSYEGSFLSQVKTRKQLSVML